MDLFTIILRLMVRNIRAMQVPPDALQDALAGNDERLKEVICEAVLSEEIPVRRSFGGSQHHISRIPSTKARIVELAEAGLTPQQISERLGVTDRYVRKVVSLMR